VKLEALQNLVQPFLDEDPNLPIYISSCCGRVYVGREKPSVCRTCPKIPDALSVTCLDDLGAVLSKIP
jgi:hypothetical protein